LDKEDAPDPKEKAQTTK